MSKVGSRIFVRIVLSLRDIKSLQYYPYLQCHLTTLIDSYSLTLNTFCYMQPYLYTE